MYATYSNKNYSLSQAPDNYKWYQRSRKPTQFLQNVILSEAKDLSTYALWKHERKILRFAQNDIGRGAMTLAGVRRHWQRGEDIGWGEPMSFVKANAGRGWNPDPTFVWCGFHAAPLNLMTLGVNCNGNKFLLRQNDIFGY